MQEDYVISTAKRKGPKAAFKDASEQAGYLRIYWQRFFYYVFEYYANYYSSASLRKSELWKEIGPFLEKRYNQDQFSIRIRMDNWIASQRTMAMRRGDFPTHSDRIPNAEYYEKCLVRFREWIADENTCMKAAEDAQRRIVKLQIRKKNQLDNSTNQGSKEGKKQVKINPKLIKSKKPEQSTVQNEPNNIHLKRDKLDEMDPDVDSCWLRPFKVTPNLTPILAVPSEPNLNVYTTPGSINAIPNKIESNETPIKSKPDQGNVGLQISPSIQIKPDHHLLGCNLIHNDTHTAHNISILKPSIDKLANDIVANHTDLYVDSFQPCFSLGSNEIGDRLQMIASDKIEHISSKQEMEPSQRSNFPCSTAITKNERDCIVEMSYEVQPEGSDNHWGLGKLPEVEYDFKMTPLDNLTCSMSMDMMEKQAGGEIVDGLSLQIEFRKRINNIRRQTIEERRKYLTRLEQALNKYECEIMSWPCNGSPID